MNILYIACLVFGLLLAIISAVAGGHGDHGGHFGHDHGHAHGGANGDVSFPYLSPAVIGSFFAAFGAGGLIATEGFGFTSLIAHLGIALGSGVGLGALAGFIILRVVRAAESSSLVLEDSLVSSDGEVVTEIPARGVGEVALVAAGSRMTFPARSESGAAIPRLAHIEVTRVVGGTVYVREHVEEKLRRLEPPSSDS
jgi:hypothetical protein